MAHKFFNNFTAGEWTPKLDGRSDLQKYDAACRRLENMRVMPYGGARFRSAFGYVAKTKSAATPSRLMPFQFSTEQKFMLEWAHLALRVYSAGAAPALLQEIASPYPAAAVFAIQYRQINDVVYLVHPDYPVQRLARHADADWRLEAVDWAFPPMLDENVTETKLSLSAVDGVNVTMTASAALFQPGHVGSYWELRHLKEAASTSVSLATTSGGPFHSAAISVQGDWTANSTERWYGTLSIERSLDGGTTWETVRKFTAESDRNISASGHQEELAQFRLKYQPTGDPFGAGVWVGKAPTNYVKARAMLETTDAYVTALVKVTAYTDSTHVKVTVIDKAATVAATDIWCESAWSPYRGFPRTIGLYEQRLIFGGTRHQPNTMWGSKTDDFENFKYGEDDDAAVAYTFAASEQNNVQWVESLKRIQAATTAREFTVAAGNTDEPLTPSNIVVRSESANGAAHLQPVLVNDAILYVERQSRKVMEMAYSIEKDGYASVDLTLLAAPVTESGVKQLAFARQPDPLLLAVTENGNLAVLTYDRPQDVTAWARWITNGAFESVATLQGTPEDEIWAVVRRTIGGVPVRTIERLTPETDSKATGCWLDCAAIVDAGDAKLTTLSNPALAHLNGAQVTAVVDGRIYEKLTVTANTITFPEAVPHARRVVVGLPYVGVLQPMKLDVILASGASQGRTRRISEITPRFYKTVGCKFGPSEDQLDEVPFRSTWDAMDASPPEYSGDIKCPWNGGHDKAGDIILVQDQPLPFTLLGIGVKWEVFGD
ncbi:hypothetical protein [Geminisphaera colitermitum]|uniref:hypothetical protein n=1 Tax=Geminisphaera colitermitum TaxID=1148786 RepID=UPI00019651DD|nr:hypothetical protein [Geminisphaera colitermitum]